MGVRVAVTSGIAVGDGATVVVRVESGVGAGKIFGAAVGSGVGGGDGAAAATGAGAESALAAASAGESHAAAMSPNASKTTSAVARMVMAMLPREALARRDAPRSARGHPHNTWTRASITQAPVTGNKGVAKSQGSRAKSHVAGGATCLACSQTS